MKSFLFPILMTTFSAFAGEISFGPYIQMQEALANDDMAKAVTQHKVICEKNGAEIRASYRDCSKKFSNISELRDSFKKLSEVYLEKGDKKELKGLMKASCPMANANWIQKEGKIANPYYGSSMLECGEKI